MLLVHFKKTFPPLYLGTAFKEDLTDYCFILKVTSFILKFPLFLHRLSTQKMVNTLLIIHNPTCKRLLIFICQEKNGNLACISNKQVINY